MRSSSLVSMYPSPSNFEYLNQSLWNLVRVSWQLSPSQWSTSQIRPNSLCACMCISLIVVRQQLDKHVPAATNTLNNRKIVGCVIFYAVRVLSKERMWASLYIPLSLKGKGSLNTLPRQRRIVAGVLFYSVDVVSKEGRRLLFSRTSCYFLRYPRLFLSLLLSLTRLSSLNWWLTFRLIIFSFNPRAFLVIIFCELFSSLTLSQTIEPQIMRGDWWTINWKAFGRNLFLTNRGILLTIGWKV
jgi:hypothetical protein